MVVILIFASRGMTGHSGLFLKADNGSNIIIVDNSPIVMSDREDEEMFENLTDGDTIFIIHDGIMESYPARTRVYACLKLSDGEKEDVADSVISSLAELGWINVEEGA